VLIINVISNTAVFKGVNIGVTSINKGISIFGCIPGVIPVSTPIIKPAIPLRINLII